MKDIAVLISTYNGEKYLKEQLDSILLQKFSRTNYRMNIFIRDDGSSDGTVNIIHNYSEKYSNIFLMDSDKNLGFSLSFLTILKEISADYYFFSDQDDVWMPGKVELFLDMITKNNNDQFICGAFSDSWIADEQAISTGKRLLAFRSNQIFKGELKFEQQIFETFVPGSSLCINKLARNKILNYNLNLLSQLEPHDFLIALIISYYGKLYFINTPTLFYRQTGENLIGARNTNKKSYLWRLKHIKNRVSDVQMAMAVGGYISDKKSQFSSEIYNISAGNFSFLKKLLFFMRYRHLVSPKHFILMPLVYSVLMKKALKIKKE